MFNTKIIFINVADIRQIPKINGKASNIDFPSMEVFLMHIIGISRMVIRIIRSNVNQSPFCISQITIGFDSDMYGRFKLSLVDNWSPSIPNIAIKDTTISSALIEMGLVR